MGIDICRFIFGFCLSIIVYSFGYFVGKSKGRIQGMEEFISVVKVFSPDIQSELLEMFDNIKTLSSEDRENKFIDYLEKHGRL